MKRRRKKKKEEEETGGGKTGRKNTKDELALLHVVFQTDVSPLQFLPDLLLFLDFVDLFCELLSLRMSVAAQGIDPYRAGTTC